MQKKLIAFNEIFTQNKSFGDKKNPNVFSFVEKKTNVCLTAPHATCSFIQKSERFCDLYTGAIVKYIGEEYGYSYIVRHKFVAKKCLISDFIIENHLENHFFLDVHAMKDGNGFDLAVGTGYFSKREYAKVLGYIDDLALKYGITYVINNQRYTGRPGLTGRLQKQIKKANVLQLEFSKNYRDIFNHFENVKNATIPFLKDLCDIIDQTKF